MSACKFTKTTLLHIHIHVFCLHFLRMIYLFNHDSSKSTIFMLDMSFDVLLSAVFVKLESLVSCNIKLFALCFYIYFFLLKPNKKNGKRFNNRVYSLFFIMTVFLKHTQLIPNILKRQSYKIFTKLAPSLTPSRSSHRKCFVKNGVLKSFTGRRRCWSLF